MTRLLLAAECGWGKSYMAQSVMESNIPDYDTALVLDYKDEYRGLGEGGIAEWMMGGPREERWGTEAWKSVLSESPGVVVARHRLETEGWRSLAESAVRAARELQGSALVAVDEAHFVAPQSGAYPDAISGLATTGRGERVTTMWITQRLSLLDKTPVTQTDARLLGGFDGDEIDRVQQAVSGYPADIHDPQMDGLSVPDGLVAEDGTIPLRKHTDDEGKVIGSEWIYSNSEGDRRRIDTRGLELETTHYSPQGETLELP